MAEAIVEMHFPLAPLPVKGFRCPVCHGERIVDDQLAAAQQLARTLGLYGLEEQQVRKLQQTGSSLAVTLDPVWVREVLRASKPGQPVRVARQGDRIVVMAA